MKRNLAVIAALCGTLVPMRSLAQENPPPQNPPQENATQENSQDPERSGFVKRKVRHFLNDDDRPGEGKGVHYGPFFPRVVIPSSGGGPGPAVHFWMPDIGGTPFDIHASAAYTIFKYQYYDAQIGLLPHRDERLPRIETGTNALFPLADLEKTAPMPGFNIYASARYRDYPKEDYFGIGPNSLVTNRADYRLKDGLYEGIIRFRVSHLSLMGRAGLLKTSVLPGTDGTYPNVETLYTNATAPGLLQSPDFIHMSAGAWLELRDEPGNPHKGVTLGAAYSRFDDRNASAFAFNRLTFDAREYIRLGSNRNVIALRQTTSLDKADAGTTIPFYLRSTLAGSTLLRGYPSFRFRDDRLLYLGSEYRFEVRPKVELAAIYEVGKVFPEATGYDFQNLRHAYGAGIRLKSPKKVHVRLDVLHGDEGTRVHLKLGPAF